jgi:hypothetical protein
LIEGFWNPCFDDLRRSLVVGNVPLSVIRKERCKTAKGRCAW